MNKPARIALIAAAVVFAAATVVLFAKYRQRTAEYEQTKAAEEETRGRYAQTIDAIAEIQDSLNAISLGDTNVRMLSRELQSEKRLSGPDSRDALDRIAVLRSSISRNKERIRQLESSLNKSGMRAAGLERMVAGLKKSVAEKEAIVAELSGQVDVLQTKVTGLETEVQQSQDTLRVRDEVLEQRRRELATIYYVVGDRKHLTDAGVVVASGGVLGLGKTLQPSGRTNLTVYTPLDTDQETVVRTNATKVKVLSAQPPSSYELILVGGQMELHIVDRAEFRKVKHLVIVTA